MNIYIVKFDWSTTDNEDVELHVFDNYEEAYARFKAIIQGEYDPSLSWIGELEFDNEGYPIGHYSLDYDDNNCEESEVYWHFKDEWDYNRHSFVDLIIEEVASKEIKAILTAIFCINQTNGNKDLEIAKICEYAFRKFLGANTNLLTLACIQRTKEDILPDIKQILKEDTNYFNIMGEFEE